MENAMFRNLSPMEICRKMSAICQKSADETAPGIDKQRLQSVSDKLSDEADGFAIQDLQEALLWPHRFS